MSQLIINLIMSIITSTNYHPTLPKNLMLIWQNCPPRTEPTLQWPSAINWIVWGRALKPHAIIGVHRPTLVPSWYVPLHDVDQKIVNTATSNKYFLALPDTAVVQSIVKNVPCCFLIIPNVHLTSFLTLSKFDEKYPLELPWSTCK